MKILTLHDTAVVACTKYRSDMIPRDEITIKSISYRIWIAMEKSFVKWSHNGHRRLGMTVYHTYIFTNVYLLMSWIIC